MQEIFDFFSFAGKEVALFIVSMIPLIELRGSVILGAAMDMPWAEVLAISLVGNILPIPVVILFGKRLLGLLKKVPFLRKPVDWYETRLLRKAHEKNMSKYSLVALCLFVAIPLPGTGAWSGGAIAALLDMPTKKAFVAILLGVVIAGVLMTAGAYGLFGVFRFL